MSDQNETTTPAGTQDTPEVAALKAQLADANKKLGDEIKKRESAELAAAHGLPSEVMQDANRRAKLAGGAMTMQQCISVSLANYRKRKDEEAAAAKVATASVTQETSTGSIKGAGKK